MGKATELIMIETFGFSIPSNAHRGYQQCDFAKYGKIFQILDWDLKALKDINAPSICMATLVPIWAIPPRGPGAGAPAVPRACGPPVLWARGSANPSLFFY